MHNFADRGSTAHARTRPSTILSRRRARVATIALGLTALAIPATAGAAPNEPPALPHTIISFPQRDFVSAAGFADGDNVVVTVIRNGIQIGVTPPIAAQDDTTTAGFDGMVEVNHPGGGCWLTNTPDILPGDIVRTTVDSSTTAANVGVQDQTTTANVTTQAPTNPSSGRIVVHGTAKTATGARLPDAQVEQRFVTTGNLFQRNGKRTLRAGGAAPATDGGKFSWDGSTTNWTVEYTNLSASDVTEVMRSDPRALWLGANPATGQELTIYESSFFGGPTAPCTAPLASNGVTASDHVFNSAPTVNSVNVTAALGLSGIAQSDASAVSVKVADAGTGVTTAVAGTLSAGTGGKTWTASIPAADVAALADGTLTASVTVTTPGGALAGTTLAIKKDTVAPAAPTATPPGGTYTANQSVSLFDADANASLFYTTDGSAPATSVTPATKAYSTPIGVNASLAIKSIALDTAGNPSAVATDTYALVASPTLTPGG
ncbi:MAG: large repetitive protein, partial [Solirubrobacteraceae bacterium]|nr:large repetitive protein [Solirubrobacteraceae bacterium]